MIAFVGPIFELIEFSEWKHFDKFSRPYHIKPIVNQTSIHIWIKENTLFKYSNRLILN